MGGRESGGDGRSGSGSEQTMERAQCTKFSRITVVN